MLHPVNEISTPARNEDTSLQKLQDLTIHAQQSVRKVALRMQIGEWILFTWRPSVALVYQQGDLDVVEHFLSNTEALPPQADGILIRALPHERYPPGVRKLKDAVQYVPRHETTYLVTIQGEFETYLSRHFSAKSRQNLKRSVRKFKAKNHDMPVLEIFTEPDQMQNFLEQASAISEKTYQTRLLDVGLQNTPQRQRHLSETAKAGNARAYVLKLNGQAIAFAWCRRSQEKLVYDIIGYLPEYAHDSPGTVLLFLILEDLFATKAYPALDFSTGRALYKEMFSTDCETLADAYLFRGTVKHYLFAQWHYHMMEFSIFVSQTLDRLGLKSAIKNLFRKVRGESTQATSKS